MSRRALLAAAVAGIGAAEASAADPATFPSGGKLITVEWFAPKPKGAGRAPAVLLLHGADGLLLAGGYRAAARTLADEGIGVGFVHYFDRTGDAFATFSSIKKSFPLWSETVRDALTWLAKQPGVDANRLGIVGLSLGAGLALATAARGESRIKAIVDFFGPISTGILPRHPKLPPVLILHGAKDATVPVAHAQTLETILKRLGTPHEIKIYPDQGHGFLGEAQADATRRTIAFLARHLGPGRSD
jgi:dienelactone hydrolase